MIPPVRPGQNITAQQLNAIVARLNELSHVSAAPPLEVVRGPGGIHIRLAPSEFMAEVVSSSGAAYSWHEVQPASSGTWEPMPGGRGGSYDAYEYNSNAVTLPSIVRMQPGLTGDWRFEIGGGNGSSGGGGGGAGDCGAFVGLNAGLCLQASVTRDSQCPDVTPGDVILTGNGTTWTGDFPGAVEWPLENPTIRFRPSDPDNCGQPTCAIWAYDSMSPGDTLVQYLTLSGCQDGTMTYVGGGSPFCDQLSSCPGPQFRVTISCVDCPLPAYCAYRDDESSLDSACYTEVQIGDGSGYTILSGPYDSTGDCLAAECVVAPPPDPVGISCEGTDYVIPGRLYATISNIVTTSGDLSCIVDGQTFQLDYEAGCNRWEVQGWVGSPCNVKNRFTFGTCPGGAGENKYGILYISYVCAAGLTWGLSALTDQISGGSSSEPIAMGSSFTAAASYSPFLLVLNGVTISYGNTFGTCGSIGCGNCTFTISETPP